MEATLRSILLVPSGKSEGDNNGAAKGGLAAVFQNASHTVKSPTAANVAEEKQPEGSDMNALKRLVFVYFLFILCWRIKYEHLITNVISIYPA